MGAVYKDKEDQSLIRIDITKAIDILEKYDILVPVHIYEQTLSHLLSQHIVGKVPADKATSYAIAGIMFDVSTKVKVDRQKLEEAAISSSINKFDSLDIAELQKTIDGWRKEFYGSLPEDKRNALVNSLEGNMNPEKLNKIKNP